MRLRQQLGQYAIREIYNHIRRLRKGNNRVEIIWVPSWDNIFLLRPKAKRQAQTATKLERTPETQPYQARSTRIRLAREQLQQHQILPDRVGGFSKRINRVLPENYTQVLYDRLKRRKADILLQLRMGMARINSYLSRIGAVELDLCDCRRPVETMEYFLFRCTKWDAQREGMRRIGQREMGNLLFFLEGKSALDGLRWSPNLLAVRATIKFAMETGRLGAREEN